MDVQFERKHVGKAGKDEWLTPPELIQALGKFDLDPCAPAAARRPWATATTHFTQRDNGLKQPWRGRVWCNPPYGTQTGLWLAKCAQHGNCIALTFARTETTMFHQQVWTRADALFFFQGRIRFCHVSGKPAEASAGAPSVLIAYGRANADQLAKVKLKGYYVRLKR